MATLYNAAERGDFTDPVDRVGWFRSEARRVAQMNEAQLRAGVRLRCAELVNRGVDVRGVNTSPTGLAMGLMFCAGFICAVPLTLALYLVVIS